MRELVSVFSVQFYYSLLNEIDGCLIRYKKNQRELVPITRTQVGGLERGSIVVFANGNGQLVSPQLCDISIQYYVRLKRPQFYTIYIKRLIV